MSQFINPLARIDNLDEDSSSLAQDLGKLGVGDKPKTNRNRNRNRNRNHTNGRETNDKKASEAENSGSEISRNDSSKNGNFCDQIDGLCERKNQPGNNDRENNIREKNTRQNNTHENNKSEKNSHDNTAGKSIKSRLGFNNNQKNEVQVAGTGDGSDNFQRKNQQHSKNRDNYALVSKITAIYNRHVKVQVRQILQLLKLNISATYCNLVFQYKFCHLELLEEFTDDICKLT